MKRYLSIIFCIACFSCSGNAKQNNASEEALNSCKTEISTLKEGNKNQEHRIDSLCNVLTNLYSDKQELEKKIEKKGNALSTAEYICLGIILVWLLIMSILFNSIIKKHDKRIRRNAKDIKDYDRAYSFEIKTLKDLSTQKTTTKRKIQSNEIIELENRINVLESKISILTRKDTRIPQKEVGQSLINKSPREAYFGMVKGNGFFNDVYTINKDESLFKIKYLSNNEVTFVPLELNKIRFIDGIEKAISYTGEKSLKDAVAYDIKSEGYAVKNGEIWEIKDKVEIVLK